MARFCLTLSLLGLVRAQAAGSRAEPIAAVEESSGRPAEGIQDNSFLIEEAYNQEVGVVQHILNIVHTVNHQPGPDEHNWSFVFTQEWPAFSQTHQLSYTIPYTFADADGRSEEGIGDISLNYRFQALMESATQPAFAPRFSLILPTGDADKGLGKDTVGYQVNLPLSKIVGDRWTVHGNAGATILPDVHRRDLVGYNLGASVIYAINSRFNFMLESVANFDEEVDDFGRTDRTTSVLISPGFRYAFNHPNQAQTVLGVAVPIGLTSDAPDYGVFLYASFEHFFYRPKK